VDRAHSSMSAPAAVATGTQLAKRRRRTGR